jgi:hypothetical protein
MIIAKNIRHTIILQAASDNAIPTTFFRYSTIIYTGIRHFLWAADFFSLRPNFSVDLAELFCQELATLFMIMD